MTSKLAKWNVDGITSWNYVTEEYAELICTSSSIIKTLLDIDMNEQNPCLYVDNDENVKAFSPTKNGLKQMPTINDKGQLLGVTPLEIIQ